MTKELFRQLIIDFHKLQLPKPSYRTLDFPKLPDSVRKANILIGMRRSGKTWALYQQMQSLLKQGIKIEQILYLNFEDERLPNIANNDLQKILDAYFELYPQYINQPNIHFFFDEIQEISGWEKFIRRLLDTEKMAIYITGSSAKMLSKEIASSLRGRTVVREIFPFSFAEYLNYINLDFNFKLPLSTKEQQIIKHHLRGFLQHGGFPEVVALYNYSTFPIKFPINLTNASILSNQFRELLQGYVNSVVQRDIIERHRLKNSHLVRELCSLCLKNCAKPFSINKNYKDLKSQGRKVSKQSLYDLMDYFEDAYCIFKVPAYSFSARKTANAEKKIYPVDQGLVTAYTIKEEYEASTRLETAVFSHLRRHYQEVYYYKTDSGKEIDFLIFDSEEKIVLYQVALNLDDPKTLRREIAALEEAMAKFELKIGTIVTLDDEREIKVSNGKIKCLPIWKLLFNY
jgi:uncharacterized protein